MRLGTAEDLTLAVEKLMCHWHSAAEASHLFPVTKEQDWTQQLVDESSEVCVYCQIPDLIRFVQLRRRTIERKTTLLFIAL